MYNLCEHDQAHQTRDEQTSYTATDLGGSSLERNGAGRGGGHLLDGSEGRRAGGSGACRDRCAVTNTSSSSGSRHCSHGRRASGGEASAGGVGGADGGVAGGDVDLGHGDGGVDHGGGGGRWDRLAG